MTTDKSGSFTHNFAARAGLSIKDAHKMRYAFVQALHDEVMKNGKMVKVPNLGTFFKASTATRKRSVMGVICTTKSYDMMRFRAASAQRTKKASDTEVVPQKEVWNPKTDPIGGHY